MPSASTRPAPLTAPASNSPRSFFARIKTPFAAKPRNIFDFDIQLDDPHRQYSPGDVVSGSVILKVIKPVRITHLVVSLHGYVQVFKTPNAPGDGWKTYQNSIGTGKGKRSGGYHGNGFATLFDDESVLCGEGRLSEGIYHFNFELAFPQKKLPSSIDFERGTVSYLLTATLTRPTTISPTSTCDRKIYFIENVDIAPLYEPKPRVISLEPKPTRSRARTAKKRSSATAPLPESKSSGSPDASDQARSRMSELGSVDENEMPTSPTPSDISFETQITGTSGSMEEAAGISVRTGDSNGQQSSPASSPSGKKPITASIELLKAGFLRGDHVPLKITVNHRKYVKSLHGIIVTLYRRATVDMHPALPVVGKEGKAKPEEPLPRSKTGLGGLSLSSSGSSHTYRKDLAQSFAPLIIDPRTLTAEVKISVRVPDEAFPTISSVPGSMISFKYFVEVVVDLQGKLAGLGRYLPNSGMLSMPSGYGTEPNAVDRPEDASGTILAAWGSNFLDTSQIRRDKTVVACLFEIIVGTKDSDRKKNKGKQKAQSVQKLEPVEKEIGPVDGAYDLQPPPGNPQDYYDYASYPPDFSIQHQDHYYNGSQDYNPYVEMDPRPPAFPIPETLEDHEATLPEKERLRLAEARLLPSAPPVADTGSSSHNGAIVNHAPSAPIIPTDELGLLAQDPSAPPQLSSYPPADDENLAGPSVPPFDAFQDDAPGSSALPAPAYESHASSSERRLEAGPVPHDGDKEDVRRRRLEMDRSAPPQVDDDEVTPLDRDTHEATAPSAPVLESISQETMFGSTASRSDHHNGALPRYER